MARRSLWIGAACVLLCVPAAVSAEPSLEVRAGAAMRSLTPLGHPPLAGYSKRHGAPSRGVHDAVQVRALVIEDGRRRVALASCELLIIDERLSEAVRRRLAAQAGRSFDAVILAATHTHSGPGAYGHAFLEKISMGHYDAGVFDFLVEQISRAILEAAARVEPVRLRTVTVPTSGLAANRMEPDGPVDADAEAVVFSGARGTVAMVVGFSAHPTTLGAWNRYVSADYPGVLSRTLEAHAPGSVCLFLAGSVGDQAPVKAGIGFERAEWIGQALAAFVIETLPRAAAHDVSEIAVAQRVIPLPPARLRLGRVTVPGWISRRLADDDASVSAVRIGPVVWLVVPCDLSAELGLSLKAYARQRGLVPMVIGFADDYVGYGLPSRIYDSGHYEALMMLNGPETGDRIIEELKYMIDELVP